MAEEIKLNEFDDLLAGLGRELEPEKDDFGAIDSVIDDKIAEDIPLSGEEKQSPPENNMVGDSDSFEGEWQEIEGYLKDFDTSFSADDAFLDLTTPSSDPGLDLMSTPEAISVPDVMPEPDGLPELGSMDNPERFEDDFLKELEGTEVSNNSLLTDSESIPKLDSEDNIPSLDMDEGLPEVDSADEEPLGDLEPTIDDGTALDDLLDGSGSSDESISELDDLFSEGSDGEMDALLNETPSNIAEGGLPSLNASEFEDTLQSTPEEYDDLFTEDVTAPNLDGQLAFSAMDNGVEDSDPLVFTDEDLQKIKRQIMFLTPKVQQLTRTAIVEQLLPEEQNNQLIRMLLSERPNYEIKKFFEENLNEDVEESEEDILDVVPRSLSKGSNSLTNVLPIIKVATLLVGSVALIVGVFLLLVKPRLDAKNAYNLGLNQIGQGKYILAEKNFYTGESLLGEDIDWYNKYGVAYRKRKEYGRAIKKFKDGLKFEKDHFGTMLNISETYMYAGDYSQARHNLKSILKSYPKNEDVLEKLGDLFIKLGDEKKEPKFYTEAYSYYKKIIDNNWESLPGQFKVMLSYIKRDMFKQTIIKLKHIKTISKKAVNVPVLTELGRYYQTKKMYYESKKVLKSVLLRDWEYHQAHFYMARYYRYQNDSKKALVHYKNAVKFSEENAKYHNELGETYLTFNDEKIPSAMKHFNLAIKYDSKYYKPYLNMGNIYFNKLSSPDLNLKNQQYRQALYYYQKVSDLAPANYANRKYFYNFGWLYYRNGQIKAALRKWSKIYEKNPFHPAVSFVMGNAFLHLKKDELARAEYEKVIDYYGQIKKQIPRVDPRMKRHQKVIKTLSNAYNNLGIAFEMKNQRTRNKFWEKKALLSFWRARALSELIGKTDYSYPYNNIRYVLHRDIKRGLAIAPELKSFSIPKTLYYEEQ